MKPLAIVYSLVDIVALRIAKQLLGRLKCSTHFINKPCKILASYYCGEVDTYIVGVVDDSIFADYLDKYFSEVKAYIFVSRHESESAKPTLTLHYPGNPTQEARYGGQPGQLAWTYPSLAKLLLSNYYGEAMRYNLLSKYSFTLEATHHGPTSLSRPVLFIEIGSSIEEWLDPNALSALSNALLQTIALSKTKPCTPVVGLGGTHYPEKHTKLMLQKDYCYGHIIAKYVFKDIRREIIEQAIIRSIEKVQKIVLLKTPSHIRRLAEEIARKHGLEVERYS